MQNYNQVIRFIVHLDSIVYNKVKLFVIMIMIINFIICFSLSHLKLTKFYTESLSVILSVITQSLFSHYRKNSRP